MKPSPKPKGAASEALKVKAFGSEHKPKAIKRLLKKSDNYRIKHF